MVTVDEAFQSIPMRWAMEQHAAEIRPFAAWLQQRWSPGRGVIELGVRHGGTSALWHQLLEGAQVLGVDRRGHDSYQEPEFTDRARQMERTFPRFRFLEGDTGSLDTLAHVTRHGPHPVGFLFIDADHSYDAVRRDFEWYSPLVVPGGFVAFHDIVDGPRTGGGVAKFWDSLGGLKTEFTCGSDWGGIGVVEV